MALNQTARIVIQGTTRSQEIWETGFWLENVGVASQSDAQDLMDTIGPLFDTDLKGIVKSMLPDNGAVTNLRGYFYVTAGPNSTYIADYPVTSGTGTGTHNLPEQVCMVATLLTGVAGRRNRGRMYFPAYGCQIAADNQFASGLEAALSDAVAEFFGNVNNITGNPTVVVYSAAGSAARPVSTIRVDSKPDIQRRRVNKEPATSTASSDVT